MGQKVRNPFRAKNSSVIDAEKRETIDELLKVELPNQVSALDDTIKEQETKVAALRLKLKRLVAHRVYIETKYKKTFEETPDLEDLQPESSKLVVNGDIIESGLIEGVEREIPIDSSSEETSAQPLDSSVVNV